MFHRVSRASTVAAIGAAITFVTMTPAASAHTSTYCGHGVSGALTLTDWTSHISNMAYPYHYNRYDHFEVHIGYTVFKHSAMTACPGGV